MNIVCRGIRWYSYENDELEVSVSDALSVSDCYSGMSFITNSCYYGICERDGGIRVMLDGKVIFEHTLLNEEKK